MSYAKILQPNYFAFEKRPLRDITSIILTAKFKPEIALPALRPWKEIAEPPDYFQLPLCIGCFYQVGIEIAGVSGYLLPNPIRFGELLIFALQFKFYND